MNHARFAFGADVTFRLNEFALPDWNDFIENVTNHELTKAGTLASVARLYLSATGGRVYAVAMEPLEYLEVGYDQFGQPLNESDIGGMLKELHLTPTGAIISNDIAIEYEVSVGDTLRAATSISDVSETMAFTIIGIAEGLSNNLLQATSQDYWGYLTVGTETLWINREYVEALIDLEQDARNVYCVRTIDSVNDTILVEDILSSGGDSVVGDDDWASVLNEVSEYLGMTAYQMDRAVDTMLTVVMVGIIFGAFTVYAVEGFKARKREIALLRAMGASSGQVVKVQGAEMLVLAIISTGLLIGYGPLMIMNTLLTYRVTNYIFPVPIFAVIPWLTLVTIVVFFLASILVFVLAIAFLSSRVSLSEALNASWAESGPYGGDV